MPTGVTIWQSYMISSVDGSIVDVVPSWWDTIDQGTSATISPWEDALFVYTWSDWQMLSSKSNVYMRTWFVGTQTNVNDPSINFITIFDTIPTIISDPSLFTIDTDGVTVNVAWDYDVSCVLFYNSSSIRVSPYCDFAVNGIQIWCTSASSYIRASGWHEFSSNTTREMLRLNKWDKVQIINSQLWAAWAVSLLGIWSCFYISKIW